MLKIGIKFNSWWKISVLVILFLIVSVTGIREIYLMKRPPYPSGWNLVEIGMKASDVDELKLGIDPNATRGLKGTDILKVRAEGGELQELMILYNGEEEVEFVMARLASSFLFKGDNIYFKKGND